MNSSRSFSRSAVVILALIFLVSFALRIYRIDRQSFWMDEIYTLQISPLPWSQMDPMIIESDNGKPPLYYLFMHQWLQHGSGELWSRLPSAFFGASTCLGAALLGMSLLGPQGWIVGILLALSPFHIWYSQETRHYALLGLFASFALFLHSKFCRQPNIPRLLGFIVFGILTCYSFPYGFFLLAVTALCAFFYRPALPLRSLILDAGAHIFIFATFIPWISHMVKAALTTGQPHKGRDLEVLIYTYTNLFFGSSFGVPPNELHQTASFLHEHPVGGILLGFAFLISLLVLGAGLRILWKENWNAFVFSVAGVTVFITGPFALSLLKPSITNNPRYAFAALFPVLIATGAFLLKTFEKRAWPHLLLATFFVAILSTSLFNCYYTDAYTRDNMRAAAASLQADKTIDAIFICTDVESDTLQYYYHGDARILRISLYPGSDLKMERSKIELLSAGSRHPVLLYLRPDLADPGHLFPPMFDDLFHLVEAKHWTGVTVFRYEKLP